MDSIEDFKNQLRCAVCLAEYTATFWKAHGENGCPRCKTAIPPFDMNHDGYIKVNWQEMRVLVIYAKRWAMAFDLANRTNQDAVKALNNIVLHLEQYQPKGAETFVTTDIAGGVEAVKAIQPKGIPSPYFKKFI